jgi:negative regulator of sigma E activity
MSNEELDSQLSAMFDDELSPAQCELLAKRLARDPALRARWGRYALIGAAMRAEPALRLDSAMAKRVTVALASEPLPEQGFGALRAPRRGRFGRWQQAIVGSAVAAGVAAVAILALRTQLPAEVQIADANTVAPAAIVASNEPDSYVVPSVIDPPSMIPTTELANYVVAHSEFAAPVVRRNTLSTLMASDTGSEELEAPAQGEARGDVDAR